MDTTTITICSVTPPPSSLKTTEGPTSAMNWLAESSTGPQLRGREIAGAGKQKSHKKWQNQLLDAEKARSGCCHSDVCMNTKSVITGQFNDKYINI